jgi:hypothetical protein
VSLRAPTYYYVMFTFVLVDCFEGRPGSLYIVSGAGRQVEEKGSPDSSDRQPRGEGEAGQWTLLVLSWLL